MCFYDCYCRSKSKQLSCPYYSRCDKSARMTFKWVAISICCLTADCISILQPFLIRGMDIRHREGNWPCYMGKIHRFVLRSSKLKFFFIIISNPLTRSQFHSNISRFLMLCPSFWIVDRAISDPGCTFSRCFGEVFRPLILSTEPCP